MGNLIVKRLKNNEEKIKAEAKQSKKKVTKREANIKNQPLSVELEKKEIMKEPKTLILD